MGSLFITATGTGVGKTFIACALARALVAGGWPTDVLKPVLSGFDPKDPANSDAGLLLQALGRPLDEIERISPWRFKTALAPPSAARAEGVKLTAAAVTKLCRERIEAAGDSMLLIEGAGGVMSPIADYATNLDLAAELQSPVLLITGSYLGAISHTLTALAAVRERGVPLVGLVVNESGGDAPPAAELIYALKIYMPGLTVFPVRRDGGVDAAPIVGALVEQDWL